MQGVCLTLGQKLEIIRRLAALGISTIDLGSPASLRIAELIAKARQVASQTCLALWCRGNNPTEIDESSELYPDMLNIALPVSDQQIHKQLNGNREQLLARISLVLAFARNCGIPQITLYLEDANQADQQFLESVLRIAEAEGANRICLSDITGVATPTRMIALVQSATAVTTLPLGVLARNTFGMATANAIAAIEAGASWVDVTILGLGKRSGNARLEEVMGYLAVQREEELDLTQLISMSRVVARMVEMQIPPHNPIIGKRTVENKTASWQSDIVDDTSRAGRARNTG